MAEWPDSSKTEVRYGVMDTGPDGKAEVEDFGTEKLEAWQASTMPAADGHVLEFIEFDATFGPVRPARLDSEPDPS